MRAIRQTKGATSVGQFNNEYDVVHAERLQHRDTYLE